jgi:hypothetical protein
VDGLIADFRPADIPVVMLLSAALSAGAAFAYRHTTRQATYSQSFAQSLVMIGMVTAIVMLIIGSNVARAFSLVGALSVIRFRNALKETRDVGFMFLVMAIGMACGSRLYLLAVAAAASLVAVLAVMWKTDAFASRAPPGDAGQLLRAVRDADDAAP